MSNHPPIITLLTDFGTTDHYVAAMKGVILSISPQAKIVDITHEVQSQNIMTGAYLLANTVPWFPHGTIHLAIVDPGVGSGRRIIAGRWGDQVIVAPDNGLVSLVQQKTPADEVYEVSNRQYSLPEISDTFQGRDIMAPAAAHLACGTLPSALGPPIDQPLTIHVPQPEMKKGKLVGQVIHIDRFGNLVTNITTEQFRDFAPSTVQIKDRVIGSFVGTYADVAVGRPLAVIGSSNMLEISVNQGSARDELMANIGDEVTLVRHSRQ